MSTDRELLELAAKAAGIDYHIDHLDGTPKLVANNYGAVWNPLCSDAQALRLAVKLGICVVFMDDFDSVGAEQSRHGVMIIEAMDEFGTRRAIVRAAAEIGRSMP